MKIVIHTNGNMYVRIYESWYNVIAVFTEDKAANAFLEIHENCSVLYQSGKVVIIAKNEDSGVKELPGIKHNIYGVPV
jgi:hypothetical protein